MKKNKMTLQNPKNPKSNTFTYIYNYNKNPKLYVKLFKDFEFILKILNYSYMFRILFDT
jgi:hypothetical protein